MTVSLRIGKRDIRPPNPPWIPLNEGNNDVAPLSYYYSDPNSEIPIRDISSRNTPKADPNIETKTFGLFGTCVKKVRKKIVEENMNFHFLFTKRENVRVLTGYYQYGWYYESSKSSDDFMLAAKRIRFVSPGFKLSDLTGYLRGDRIDKKFRVYKYVKGETPNLLLRLLEETPDSTSRYVAEIRRLEQELFKERGQIYFDGKKGFDWNEASKPMGLKL